MDFSKVGVRILVRDFQGCFDFYTQKLGLSVLWGDRNGPFASFCVAGSDNPCFSMFLFDNMNLYKGYEALGGTGGVDRAVYVIPTTNVDGDFTVLKDRGVCFAGEPQTIEEWFMRCVYFRDPEGNLFELCQELAF